ncbi:SusC/RagA family TonB-linked outer membrane protein [Aquimarina pacifica]|uniref:SusC/RagA family TonB-linked outer membrane protein n=1 Tax=Aquimarina pacifica TaxID=1296415 RepID=UPI0004B08630|nr:TonB-dependent receptor [Aquimarina pacifica]
MKIQYHKLLLFLFFIYNITFSQEMNISGTVTDDKGLPLPGVNVLIKNSNKGTQTNFDGNYSIAASNEDVLSFSFIGFITKDVKVGDKTIINVQFTASAAELDEVVIIGFGTSTERKLIQNIGTVRTAAIENIPAVTAQELLQGQTSGVQFTQSSGVLGAANIIRVRGVASLNGGSQPLIVIDGVPLSDDVNTFNVGGNTGLNPISDLSPGDIASFSVLKDAAATAIWGSRGANGVVLIKTKMGSINTDTKINADVWTSFTNVTDLVDILDVNEYAKYRFERGLVGASGGINAVSDLPADGSDWLDLATRTGFSQNYNVSAQGGGKKTSFFIGTGYSSLEGGIVGNNLRRISGRVNLNHTANEWLDLGLNLSVTNTLNDRVNVENTTFAPLTSSYLIRPFIQSRDEEGNFINNDFIQNIEAIEALQENSAESTRIIGNMSATIKLTEEIDYKGSFGIDRSQNNNFLRIPELIDPSADGGITPGGNAQNFMANDNRIISDHTLSYNTTFNDIHTIGAVAGLSYQETTFNTINVASEDFLSDDLRNVSNGAVPTLTAQSREKRSLYGAFGRINYDYKGKYIIEGSFRRDGFSRFGVNKRFGNFWSLAGGWLVSEESFMEELENISLLKLRVSYGTSGNDRIGGSFPSQGLFGSAVPLLTATYNYNGSGGIAPIQPVNPDLTYEESATLDVGLELGLFNNRFNLNLNYFKKNTTDLLLPVPITEITGFATINKNAGELENRGVEIGLNTKNVVTDNFTWSTNFNISFVDTEVISLPGANDSDEGKFIEAAGARQRAIEGESTNNFYLVRYVGVNSQTGDAEYLDKDGNTTTSPNFDTDRVIVGDALPDFYGGITNTFTYKNFDLSFLMSFTYGNDIFLDGLRFVGAPDRVGTFNQSSDVLNYWQQPGDNAKYPRLGSDTESLYRQASSFQLRDGTFLRMRNLTFGYTLPNSVFKNNKIFKKLRIYATGNNLFVIKGGSNMDGFDPEVTDNINPLIQGETFFTAPQARQFLLGTRITF